MLFLNCNFDLVSQEHQLQQQNQRVEEMEMVIQNKNIEIR